MKNTDLHTHSYYSDGLDSPKEIIRIAKRRKVKNIAITDHNSIKGVKQAIREGRRLGINIIPGVEITCRSTGKNLRGGEILGYFIDLNSKDLKKALEKNAGIITQRTKLECKRLRTLGYDISMKKIKKMFPKAEGNYNSFFPLLTIAFEKKINPLKLSEKTRKARRVKRPKSKIITMIQAIKVIKKSGGIPVLAHPWLGCALQNFKDMPKYVRAGLKGIEMNNGDNHPFRDKKYNKLIKKAAKKYNLIITGGTDFHGNKIAKYMPGEHRLGYNNISEKVVKQLEKRK